MVKLYHDMVIKPSYKSVGLYEENLQECYRTNKKKDLWLK